MSLHPGYHYTDQHGPVMSKAEVKALARKWGLPARGIMQIARGESGLKPHVQQRDPGDGMVGYGLLQMTPNAWGKDSAAYKHMMALGGIDAMKDPDKNMQMARFLYKAAGNSFKPWYGTKFLTDRSGEGTLGKPRRDVPITNDLGRPPRLVKGGETVDKKGAMVAALLDKRKGMGLLDRYKAQVATGGYTTSTAPRVEPGQPGKKQRYLPDGATTGNAKGKVIIASGANRAGVDITPALRSTIAQLAGAWGKPLTIGTGTNHNQMTTSGNVSDHWSGNGADIPASGATLTKLGRRALVTYGMSPAEAAKANGGIYNLQYKGRRIQVIFNTREGGNHWNHLHVGISH